MDSQRLIASSSSREEGFDPIAYINAPRWQKVSLGLGRIEALLEGLGNPQDKLRFVHVAGTNGKGSTCSFLSSILQEAGYRVGLFTSPYLIEFSERIRVDGRNIPLDDLTRATLRVKAVAETLPEHPTEFELMTAVAFVHFEQCACDIVVAEVGLGGRLDSTNVITTVEASVITPIAFDHCALLGDTLREIASEKAGIMKPGVPVVCAVQDEEALHVIEARADELGCILSRVDASALFGDNDAFSYGPWKGLTVASRARYQRFNAALALEAAVVLRNRGWAISDEAARAGLAKAQWPGRFELVRTAPDVIIDGGHNLQGAQALAESLRFCYPDRRFVFVLGVLADKDYHEMLDVLAPLAKTVHCVQVPNPRSLSSTVLSEAMRSALRTAGSSASVMDAGAVEDGIRGALAGATSEDVICICGSLYSIGDAKRALAKIPAMGNR